MPVKSLGCEMRCCAYSSNTCSTDIDCPAVANASTSLVCQETTDVNEGIINVFAFNNRAVAVGCVIPNVCDGLDSAEHRFRIQIGSL